MSDEIRCPKCHSNQIASGQQGFGVGKAAVGLVALGPLGLAGGLINRKKVELHCLSCGNRWQPTPVKPPPPTAGDAQDAFLGLMVLAGIIAVIFGVGALLAYAPGVFLFLVFLGTVFFVGTWITGRKKLEEKKRVIAEAYKKRKTEEDMEKIRETIKKSDISS